MVGGFNPITVLYSYLDLALSTSAILETTLSLKIKSAIRRVSLTRHRSTPVTRVAAMTVAVAFTVFASVALWGSSSAQEQAVRFIDAGLVSEFPEAIKFHASVETDLEVEDIRVRFGVGHGDKNRYNYLDLDDGVGSLINGELEWSFNTTGRYIPPGSVVRFHFEVLDTEGNEHVSEEYETIMHDARFEWDEVDSGPIKVYYHGPVETRATRLAATASELIDLMQPITGGETVTPISVTLYNNNAEMIGAVQRRSATTSRELITEGQAFHEESVVLVLANTRDIGTLTHELTHILVGRAAGGTAALVPLWLNEGLAEYGNLDQGLSYQYYLEWAVDTGRLKPFSSLTSFPGDPSLNLVAYGQSRSFVTYLIDTYGGDHIAQVLALISEGNPGESAIRFVYGESLRTLENEWRYQLGADEYVPPNMFAAPATATPEPTPEPVALPTATPEPEPVEEQVAVAPTATAEVPVEDASDDTEQATPSDADDSTSVPAPADIEPTVAVEESGGGLCNGPARNGRAEATSLAFVIGMLAFGAVRVFNATRRQR